MEAGHIHLLCSWSASQDEDAPDLEADSKDDVCNRSFSESDVVELASPDVLRSYTRWKENNDPLLRRCPFCDAAQHGDPKPPAMTCRE